MIQLTTKELSVLTEQLNAEQSLVAKYNRLANETQDQTLRMKFGEIAQRHQSHYDIMFAYLRQGGNMEKNLLSDALQSQKFCTSMYNMAAGECDDPQLRQTLMNLLDEEHKIQNDIFTIMKTQGFYPIKQATNQQVMEARTQLEATN